MATLDDRPFSKDYRRVKHTHLVTLFSSLTLYYFPSGLINQSVITGGLIVICLAGPWFMKVKRRGLKKMEGLGSIESWEFGYLYQARSWARNPSPPLNVHWPIQWILDALLFSELKLLELRGLDATLYSRFLRGCAWFTLVHSLTTVAILLPVHVHFAGPDASVASMTRASISALVETETGHNLLWIHLILLFWITFSWIGTLAWISYGAFKYRALVIERAVARRESEELGDKYSQYHPHPQPQHLFSTLPSLDKDRSNRGIRLRTVMVTNIPPSLRSEKDLGEYFQHYLSQPVSKSLPVPFPLIDSRPGIANKVRSIFVRAAQRSTQSPVHPTDCNSRDNSLTGAGQREAGTRETNNAPMIDRVVIARKMTELASLLDRREEVLKKLETAHIHLAKRVLGAVRLEMLCRGGRRALTQRISLNVHSRRTASEAETAASEMDVLVRELGLFVEEFDLLDGPCPETSWKFWRLREQRASINLPEPGGTRTVWDALHTLPRAMLDQYQPLMHLSVLFRDKSVPAIDYYTAKLGLITSLIAENRAKSATQYDPVSTAFVTFRDPKDALKAYSMLAAHPNNILSCQTTMAPCYEDLNWMRIMKSTYKAEFLKDWVVNIGVWGFTIFWLFPLSLFVGLISIQNISVYWPSLFAYISHHPWEEEVIQSFVPTVIVSLLTLLIPVLLLLIAKKAHTIVALSHLHDRIMARYYKFLIVNILVFFCVGTAALQSFLLSFTSGANSTQSIVNIVASSFPTAGPFYVGWMIFTTGIHSALEAALFGLPLISYLSTRQAVVPRQRAVGIRPRTFNYFYWLPNHLLVFEVIIVFSILNPLVVPFGCVYFVIDSTVIRNQFVHVYAKVYEANGKVILIRLVRYSLDGVILLQVVFLAYMAVLKIKANVAVTAVLIAFTAFIKLGMTRIIRYRFKRDDLVEAEIICGTGKSDEEGERAVDVVLEEYERMRALPTSSRLWRTWKNLSFGYSTHRIHAHHGTRKRVNPFSRPRATCVPQVDDKLLNARRSSSPADMTMGMSPVSPHEKISEVPTSRPRQSQVPVRVPMERGPVLLPAPRALVVPHPPVPAWDDEPDPDTPYDNPYYSAPIGSSLWLPRNPCGILDLDDTVDVRRALTTVEVAGELGQWQAMNQHPGPSESPPTPSPLVTSPEHEDLPHSPSLATSGTETISLPPRIESRVDDPAEFDRELEISPHRPLSFFGSRSSTQRSTIGATSYFNVRSVGLGGDIERGQGSLPMGSRTMMSSFSLDPRSRKRGTSMEEVVEPDISSQAHGMRPESGAPPALLPYHVEPSAVTMQEAVQAEVIAEEQEVTDARLREETHDAELSMHRRPWYERWAFAQPAE
ncbi:hypothetical protein K488DRAFT_41147 [Vararia minispora EC-137]|uniref:Uncharacterized protein n=1 Tax=Vararia minispora EC-137 TaxID=1314806 RepID=A0ACB8QX93_9AGAM|nr:hypothetical protein K488DRAFT_41147 [Vararia minispora EC-137]